MKHYPIGYTTGVFDMFHIGHLNLLMRAKERCGRLIVGVCTDELAQAIKPRRPVIPFAERMEIIRALRCADEVVAQRDRDLAAAYETLRFNCVFKGADWRHTPLWEKYARELAPLGVDIVFLPYTEGTSSTLLAQKLSELL